jgi:hypothetical protein
MPGKRTADIGRRRLGRLAVPRIMRLRGQKRDIPGGVSGRSASAMA